jgi:hypothetical protein
MGYPLAVGQFPWIDTELESNESGAEWGLSFTLGALTR